MTRSRRLTPVGRDRRARTMGIAPTAVKIGPGPENPSCRRPMRCACWRFPAILCRCGATPMRVNDAVNIEDLHRLAKRKLPKVMFDYIEGGVEDERGLSRNEAA